MRPSRAVILAAGRGMRLGPLGEETPKGFLEVGGQSLIERSLAALRGAGIERVTIVSGHLADRYDALAKRAGPWLTVVHNPEYAASGSFVSLACVRDLQEPYLLVESDLLYEARAPQLLVDSDLPDLLLASGQTSSGDEVYVGVDGDRLIDLSKRPSELRGRRAGELVGLTRVSPELHAEMLVEGRRLLADTPNVEYESAIVAAARRRPVRVLVVGDLVWTEVDDVAQLHRATATVLPRLV